MAVMWPPPLPPGQHARRLTLTVFFWEVSANNILVFIRYSSRNIYLPAVFNLVILARFRLKNNGGVVSLVPMPVREVPEKFLIAFSLAGGQRSLVRLNSRGG
jgi:hypothetical protein